MNIKALLTAYWQIANQEKKQKEFDKLQTLPLNYGILKDLINIHKGLIFDKENFIKKTLELSPNKDDQEMFLTLRRNYNEKKSFNRS
jgi:hypothetical protein